MTLNIRKAEREDAALILRFIGELAVYEKLADDVVASVDDIERALFCENPKVFALIAEWEGAPCGFALYFFNFSTFLGRHGVYLEDLFVRETHRGKGIGKALLARLAAIAVENDCGRLEWSVLDWNAPSIAFYKSLGALPMDEWTVYRLTGPALVDLAGRG
ncbi:MAG: N-acetyltransferase family protein [Parvularculaceae bacterium]|nr:GNAT family N-acetyltransferase [Parvularculaceae bacterium]